MLLSGRRDAGRDRVSRFSGHCRGLLNPRSQAHTAFPVSVVRSVYGREASLLRVG
jgi:hypothetical protein